MRRYSAILVLLLFHYASSVQCFPEADYEDGVPDLGDDEFSSPYDESDSDTDIQPLLDPPPDLISAGAGAGDDCSTFDMTPNGKIRARGAVCSSDQAPPPSTPLDIPTLDIFHDTNYLCPFDMNFGYRILVCGKPLSIYGLAPEIVTTVKEARLCKSTKVSEKKRFCITFAFC